MSGKKIVPDTKKGHYCTLLCDIPLPAPLYCLQYCAIYFPHDPLYCNKILAISCKGQAGRCEVEVGGAYSYSYCLYLYDYLYIYIIDYGIYNNTFLFFPVCYVLVL